MPLFTSTFKLKSVLVFLKLIEKKRTRKCEREEMTTHDNMTEQKWEGKKREEKENNRNKF